jgi:Tol biopolymer transport system component
MKQRRSRRWFCTALGGLAAASTLASSCSSAQPDAQNGVAQTVVPTRPAVLTAPVSLPTAGKLVIVQNGNLSSFDLAALQGQPITHFPKGTYAWWPALSHDRKRLAFGYYAAPTGPNDQGRSDLYVADVSGANAQLLHQHPVAGATFEEPCWTADDRAVLVTLREPIYKQGEYQSTSVTIVRVGVDGTGPTVLVKDGMGPGTSPDGKYLAYTGVDPHGAPSGFYVGDPAGNSATPILGDQGFRLMRFPAFSPDSTHIVFSAIGGPAVARSSTTVGWLPPGFGIAEADGPPWELWAVRPDGTDLQRLTHVSEDTPVPTWSPTGAWIAFAGSYGLYLIDAGGGQATRLSRVVSGGGVAWPS